MPKIKKVSLEDIKIDNPPKGKSWARIINSPRSLEAFRRVGIKARELDPVNIQDLETELKQKFGSKKADNKLLVMRIEHLNKNRHSKFNMVKSERESIIFEANNWLSKNNNRSFNQHASYRTKSVDDYDATSIESANIKSPDINFSVPNNKWVTPR